MNFLREEETHSNCCIAERRRTAGPEAEYFSGKNFQGTPVLTRVDKSVNLQVLNADSSALVLPSDVAEVAVRWTGFLIPVESGTYKVGITGSMNRMWLDDK